MIVLIQKLFDYQRKNLFLLVLSGIIYLTIFFVIIWLSTFTADSVFQFSGPVRWAILVFNSLLSGVLVWSYFLKNLFDLHSLRKDSDFTIVADDIGRQNPEISDRYKNIYQLITNKPIGASAELQVYWEVLQLSLVYRKKFYVLPSGYLIQLIIMNHCRHTP
jgi:hypothetical protein